MSSPSEPTVSLTYEDVLEKYKRYIVAKALNQPSPTGGIFEEEALKALQQIEQRHIEEAEIKARIGMVEYYDQVPANKDMDWKGLFADNLKLLKYELSNGSQVDKP